MNPPEVIDRYQILQGIGQGGMGSIYLARDPKIANRHIVIKLLREGFDNAELRERFSREADAAGGLHHVNIVTIFDVGEFNGQPFIAMEYIQGETLTDIIRRRAPLSLSRKLQLMEELCAGLRYAHRAGIIHRDIKPANIMVDQDGVLKILDFGIARLGSGGMTRAGMVMGTLNYMAPEQMAGQPVDARADIFSAGAVFYELLSYQRAFPGDLPGIVHKIMTASREPLSTLVPDVDPAIVAIVDRCLHQDLNARYEDMAAVRRDIAAIRQRIVYNEQRSLDTHMGEARSAVERGDLKTAIDLCDQVLALDSEYQPAIELQQRARYLLDSQQVSGWLAEAEQEISRGAMTAAQALVTRAEGLTVNASSPDAEQARAAIEAVKRRIVDARTARQRDEEARRAQEAERERQEAERQRQAIERERQEAERRRQEEEARARAEAEAERRATEAVDAARAQWAAGDHVGAVSLLGRFQPAHPLVTNALRELREEVREIERRRLEAEQAERAREAARQRQEAERHKQEELARQAATIRFQPEPAAAARPAATVQLDRATVPEAVAPAPAPRPTVKLAAAAVVLVAVLAGAMLLNRRSPATAPGPAPQPTPQPAPIAASTAVVLQVAPWANIDAITRKSDGQPMGSSGLVTPCVVSLPPGEYHVRASNPNFSALEFDLTVQSGDSQIVRREMPGFNSESEVMAIVGR